VRRLLALALLATAVVLADAGPAHACSVAVPRSDAEAIQYADIAFTAEVRSVTQDGGRVVWGLDVEDVYRGVVADDQEVVSVLYNQCQTFRPRVGQRWLLFAHTDMYFYDAEIDPGQLRVSLGRTRPLGKDEAPIVPSELPVLLWS
jgi:hypothetical protein